MTQGSTQRVEKKARGRGEGEVKGEMGGNEERNRVNRQGQRKMLTLNVDLR